MPEVNLKSPADRGEGVLINMHPRLADDGCEVILTPNDLFEGKGDFLNPDTTGNPPGFQLIAPRPVTGRNVYAGTAPSGATQQNTIDIAVHESSVLLPLLVEGDPPPEQFVESTLPKPPAPILTKVKAEVVGYPATTLERPMWITYAWGRNSVFSQWAPATLIPPFAQGQCLRVKLPGTIPPGVQTIALGLTIPGQSTASQPGQVRLQKNFPLSFASREVELKGPFIYDPTVPRDTALPSPGAVNLNFVGETRPVQVGSYRFAMTVANELGESKPGPLTGSITVPVNPYWGEDNPAGLGTIVLSRGALPAGVTGWYLYTLFNGNWYKIFKPATSEGLRQPLSTSITSIRFGGWTGSEFWGKNHTYLMSQADIPLENTTAVELPDTPLDVPQIFGSARMAPGKVYVRTSDLTEEEESPLSDAASIDVGADEILRVVFASRVNKLQNATFVEQGADGIPLSYTASGIGASVEVEDGEAVIKADGSGSTFEFSTDAITIDRTKEWGVGAFLDVQQPETGAFGGSFQVVLREIGVSTTDTVLEAVTAVGQYRYHSDIFPSGHTPDLAWKPDTVQAQIVYKFPTTSKMVVRLSRQLLADYAYTFRRRDIESGVSNPNPAASQTAPPTGTVALEPSPYPAESPETTIQQAPDRPTYSGEVLLEGDFESAMPTGSTSHAQNATLAREAGAALVGTTGLASRKTGAGSSAYAYLDNTLVLPAGLTRRNDGAVSTRRKVPTLPTNGSITLQELRGADGERYAWVDLDTRNEASKLEINSPATASGNITTTLDEGGVPTARTTAVVATPEKATISITSPPSVTGDIGVTLSSPSGQVEVNIPVNVQTQAAAAQIQLEITRGCARSGGVAFYFAEPWPNARDLQTSYIFSRVYAGDTPETVAGRLRQWANSSAWQSDYWTISGSGRFVTLTAKFSAPMSSDYLFFIQQGNINTYVQARASIINKGRQGVPADTEESIARRIYQTPLPGYKATLNANSVTVEALDAGAQTNVAVNPRSTGVAISVATDVEGVQDTPEQIASKVATTYSGNSYVSASASGSTVTFASLTSGEKQDATFSAGITGTRAKMSTPIQGSSDIVAYAKDSFGTLRQKRVLTGITNTTIFDVDLAASGVGLPPSAASLSRAVVQVFVSKNAEPKTLGALFEDIDYENVTAGGVAYGVTAESSPSLTWEVYTDLLKITDRGEDYYRYHNYYGELLNQVHGFLVPGYLPRDGLLIQGGRLAVLPGEEYTMGVFLRWAGVRNPAQPFYLYCVTPEDEIKSIGSLTATPVEELDPATGAVEIVQVEQVVGTSDGWSEFVGTFTIPSNCYELRLESRKIGEGEIVVQELAMSKGSELIRNPLYQTSGSYSATLDLGTPNDPGLFWHRERKILSAQVNAPSTTSVDVVYRTADTQAGPFDVPVSDPALAQQKNVIRVDYTATGNGATTPVIPVGSPHTVYVMKSQGDNPLSTFLKGDRTELDGGVIFSQSNEFIEPADLVFTPLPGGRVQTTVLFGPTGSMPEAEILVFDPEAVRYITHRAGLMPFVIETPDKVLTVNLTGPVRFERVAPNRYELANGSSARRQAVYKAKLPECWVTESQELP